MLEIQDLAYSKSETEQAITARAFLHRLQGSYPPSEPEPIVDLMVQRLLMIIKAAPELGLSDDPSAVGMTLQLDPVTGKMVSYSDPDLVRPVPSWVSPFTGRALLALRPDTEDPKLAGIVLRKRRGHLLFGTAKGVHLIWLQILS